MNPVTQGTAIQLRVLGPGVEHMEKGALRFCSSILIGRGRHCDLVLRHWKLAHEHVRLTAHPVGVLVEDLGGLTGTWLAGRRIARAGPIPAHEPVRCGPYEIYASICLEEHGAHAPDSKTLDEPRFHAQSNSDTPDTLACGPAADPQLRQEAVPHALEPPRHALPDDQALALQQELQHELLIELDLRRHDLSRLDDARMRMRVDELLGELMQRTITRWPAGEAGAALRQRVLEEAVGLGPLEPLMRDPNVTEIMVNSHRDIWFEREGRMSCSGLSYSSEAALRAAIERIVAPLGRRIDESSPMVDARLPDGSRINAVLPPIALKGACLTIRRFPQRLPEMNWLLAEQALSPVMAQFLDHAVRHKASILVSGGTGSGKTTLLNVLSHSIPHDERIITIEDAAELKLAHPHWLALEARPANAEGCGAISIRDLVRNALRMRPSRIIVGECRGAESLDLLSALNTGHEGSLTTLHANTPRDALARLETLVLMAGIDLPLSAIREQIASALDLVVQLQRMPGGQRRIVSVAEVGGVESGRIQLQDIFLFRESTGHQACGIVPALHQEWRERQVALPIDLYQPDAVRAIN